MGVRTGIVIGLITAILALSITTPLATDGSLTTLALKPETVKVPYLSLDQGFGSFYIDAYLSNVQDLKWFKLHVIFDGGILEPLTYHGTPSEWSGGGTASGGTSYGAFSIRSYELRKAVSGSGVLLRFWFKPKGTGITKIEFREVELRNSNGDLIPCTCIGNQVEVVPFDTWVNGEYQKLSEKYQKLQTQYTDLEAKYNTLSSQCDSLADKHDALKSDYAALEAKYRSLVAEHDTLKSSCAALKADYASLSSQHDSLAREHDALKSNYAGLEAKYTSLSSEHDSLVHKHDALKSEYAALEAKHRSAVEQVEKTERQLNTMQAVLYVFVGLTAVFACAMVFLLVRRRRLAK